MGAFEAMEAASEEGEMAVEAVEDVMAVEAEEEEEGEGEDEEILVIRVAQL